MPELPSTCFVCGKKIDKSICSFNKELNLPVCNRCKGTDEEKKSTSDLIDGLADGFVCGCI